MTGFSNVIAPARLTISKSTSADAKLLADSSAPEIDRIGALSRLAAQAVEEGILDDDCALPLFTTRSHTDLLRVFTQFAEGLRDGRFIGTNGPSSQCLVGLRGIGKTNFMRVFMAVCRIAYPSIIPLFVTGVDILHSRSSFAVASLDELVFATAAQNGLHAATLHQLGRMLTSSKQQMLIVLDEIDQLYRVPRDDAARRRTIDETIGALSTLGNAQRGVYGTILCGSSASTYNLIAARQVEKLRDRFPLLRHTATDLNDTKFCRHIVAAADCTDIEQVQEIMAHTRTAAPCHEDDRRSVSSTLAFVAGSVPRTIANTLAARRAASQQQVFSSGLLGRLFSAGYKDLSAEARVLYTFVFKRLLHQNDVLVKTCTDKNGSLRADTISSGAWAPLLKPIDYKQVERAFIDEESVANADFSILIQELADANLIMVRSRPEKDDAIWPMSAAQLLLATPAEPWAFMRVPDWMWDALERAANMASIGGLALQLLVKP
jgi:hypothetical protein